MKGPSPYLALGIGIAAILIAGVFVWNNFVRSHPEPVACTMEAKLCPDGSAVGRTGPLCEFTPCPTTAFSKEGNLVRNNPGLTPATWYLVYESAGAPALTTELVFNTQSTCVEGGVAKTCEPTIFMQGARVSVEGTTQGDTVIVHTLTLKQADETGVPIKFYYYNQNLDKDATGNIQCSRSGLVPVSRVIPRTITPIQDAVKLLLRGEVSSEEKAQGVSTEFPLAGVSLVAASLNNGVLTLTFNDPQNRTGGGSCRVGILWFQIEATAKQFPGVQSVRFMPEELFQP